MNKFSKMNSEPITTACLLHIQPVWYSVTDGYRILNFGNFRKRIEYAKIFGICTRN